MGCKLLGIIASQRSVQQNIPEDEVYCSSWFSQTVRHRHVKRTVHTKFLTRLVIYGDLLQFDNSHFTGNMARTNMNIYIYEYMIICSENIYEYTYVCIYCLPRLTIIVRCYPNARQAQRLYFLTHAEFDSRFSAFRGRKMGSRYSIYHLVCNM